MPAQHRAPTLGPGTRRGHRAARRSSTGVSLAAVASFLVFAPTAEARAAAPTCQGVRATIVGRAGSDTIQGTPGRDVIVGLGGNDTIHGRGGADLVCGGDGADRLYGGPGDDRLFGQRDRLHRVQEDGTERDGDLLAGGSGDDRMDAGQDDRRADIVVEDTYSWADAAHGVQVRLDRRTARGEGADTFARGRYVVIGSSYGDHISGSERRDRIEAGGGPDVVHGRGGADVIALEGGPSHGGDGDRAWGGSGRDRISAGQGEDLLAGGSGRDWIESRRGGNDVVRGGPGDDYLWLQVGRSEGPQVFDGGGGSDLAQVNTDAVMRLSRPGVGVWDMRTGEMTITVDDPIALTVRHLERSLLVGRGSTWTVTGTPGDDFLAGPAEEVAPTTFYGLGGDDTFTGTDGDDYFDGGAGHDTTHDMGLGTDTCLHVEVIDPSGCETVG